MSYVGIFVKHTYALCIETKRSFVNKEQRGDNSLKLPMGRMSLAMS